MLRITVNKSSSGAKKYYSETYYNEGQSKQLDYYSEKDQTIGLWGGKAAEKLGLNDAIRKSDFAALCDNKRPDNGKTLTGRTNENRRVGYDFTFNASKSISLAYSFAPDEEKKNILAAFRESVRDSMTEIETGMQARVRDKGNNENRETGNIAYGEFVHFSTRPIDGVPDPHLHSHCFVFNATHDEKSNKWKAGQFRQIKEDAPYYEAFFHSKLAEKLQNIGYQVERSENGFELKGVSKETIDKFSRRTKEIEEHAKEKGITDNKAKSDIGSRTRESKRAEISAEKQFEHWQARLTKEELSQLRNLKSDSSCSGKNEDKAKTALDYSLSHHMERKSVASDKEILATAIKSSIGKATPEQIKKELGEKKEVFSIKEKLRTFITTQEALNEEKQLIQNANSYQGKFAPINEQYEFKANYLNGQQKEAITHALTTQDGLTIISGKAGTGKTTLMKEVQQGIREAGKEIFAFAPSAEASRVVQRKEGFENANTVASLIQNDKTHSQLKNQIIWVDEAGLLSNKDMNKVFSIAKEQSARIILSGDTKQHNSVQRGDALRVIQKYSGVKPITVSRIQRQKESLYKRAVKLFSKSDVEKGFSQLDKIGSINEIENDKERIKGVANDYCASAFSGKKEKNILVVSPTHKEGERVTKEIRNQLKELGKLEGNDREFTTLKNLQYTSAQKNEIENYKEGMILSFHQNIKGVQAGSKLRVTRIDGKSVLASDGNGKAHNISLANSDRYNVFEERTTSIAKGDKIRITSNGKTMEGVHLFNGGTYNVKGFDRQGNIRLSNGARLPKTYGHFTNGYVMTSHSSQGKTADKVIISQSSLSKRASSMEQFYVSVSRGRQAVSIYTNNKKGLLDAIKQTTQRKAAIELLPKKKQQNMLMQNSRSLMLSRMKGKAGETVDKVMSKIKNYELPRASRTSPGKSR